MKAILPSDAGVFDLQRFLCCTYAEAGHEEEIEDTNGEAREGPSGVGGASMPVAEKQHHERAYHHQNQS
jgi:hypothetical protein